LDDGGSPVAWFVLLKYPKGGAALIASSKNETLNVSPHDCASPSEGAMALTLLQLYEASRSSASSQYGVMFYNDQPPPASAAAAAASAFPNNQSAGVSYGHSKGVVGWEAESGFWLVHSFPEFPSALADGYKGVDESQQIYGQSVMCVSTDATGLDVVGEQLQYNYAQIYEAIVPADATPKDLAAAANGQHFSSAIASTRELVAIDGTKFTSFSKTGQWGKELYSDLVAPGLEADLLVETWIRGGKIPSSCPTSGYSVKNVQMLQFPNLPAFKETQDHSKWAISVDENVNVTCVGGINQMTSQNTRGGGTVCLQNNALWNSFSSLVYQVEECE
jgi:deoxyribonuclease-2